MAHPHRVHAFDAVSTKPVGGDLSPFAREPQSSSASANASANASAVTAIASSSTALLPTAAASSAAPSPAPTSASGSHGRSSSNKVVPVGEASLRNSLVKQDNRRAGASEYRESVGERRRAMSEFSIFLRIMEDVAIHYVTLYFVNITSSGVITRMEEAFTRYYANSQRKLYLLGLLCLVMFMVITTGYDYLLLYQHLQNFSNSGTISDASSSVATAGSTVVTTSSSSLSNGSASSASSSGSSATSSGNGKETFLWILGMKCGVMLPLICATYFRARTRSYEEDFRLTWVCIVAVAIYPLVYNKLTEDYGVSWVCLMIMYFYSCTPIRFFPCSIFCLLYLLLYVVVMLAFVSRDDKKKNISTESFYACLFYFLILFPSQMREFAIRVSYMSELMVLLQQEQLKMEETRSKLLLDSMLPESVVVQLQSGRELIADEYPNATVLFAEVCDFDGITSKLKPQQVVELLNIVFSKFDKLVDKHSVHKVETIGAVYMVVGGCPELREDHAEIIANLALDMLSSMVEIKQKVAKRLWEDLATDLNIRIGINTGGLMAGVVGIRNPRFKLFGVTVNVASRMETTNVSGRIQITEATHAILVTKYHTEPRGKIFVKGKGEMVTYFLVGRKDQLRLVHPVAHPGFVMENTLAKKNSRNSAPAKSFATDMETSPSSPSSGSSATGKEEVRGAAWVRERKQLSDNEKTHSLPNTGTSVTPFDGSISSPIVSPNNNLMQVVPVNAAQLMETSRTDSALMNDMNQTGSIEGIGTKRRPNGGKSSFLDQKRMVEAQNSLADLLALSRTSSHHHNNHNNQQNTSFSSRLVPRLPSGAHSNDSVHWIDHMNRRKVSISQAAGLHLQKIQRLSSQKALYNRNLFDIVEHAEAKKQHLAVASEVMRLPEGLTSLGLLFRVHRFSSHQPSGVDSAAYDFEENYRLKSRRRWMSFLRTSWVAFLIMKPFMTLYQVMQLSKARRFEACHLVFVLNFCVMYPSLAAFLVFTFSPYVRKWEQLSCTAVIICVAFILNVEGIIMQSIGHAYVSVIALYQCYFSNIAFILRFVNGFVIVGIYLISYIAVVPQVRNLNQDKEERQLRIEVGRNALYTFIFFAAQAWIMFNSEFKLRINHHREITLNNQKLKLIEEEGRITKLLRNLLPPTIVEKLKENPEATVADFFDNVTVLFTDMVNFTAYSSRVTAMELVQFLNDMYTRFDTITERGNLYKVEIIGDAYFVVGGCPVVTNDTAVAVVTAAIEILASLPLLRRNCGVPDLNIRIGIHTGPVLAGVVGFKDPRYHLFGETVTIAEFLESSGVPGRIQISESTWSCMNRDSPSHGFKVEYRTLLTLPSSTKKIRTYFVI